MPLSIPTDLPTPGDVAARVRALSDEALCALLDCAIWADQTGDLTTIAPDAETHAAIVATFPQGE